MCMIHIVITLESVGGQERVYNIWLPPAFLTGTDPKTLLDVILARLPVPHRVVDPALQGVVDLSWR